MDCAEFLEELQDLLQTETVLRKETKLESLEEWDSLSQMTVMAWLDRKFGIHTPFKSIVSCREVSDVINLARRAIK